MSFKGVTQKYKLILSRHMEIKATKHSPRAANPVDVHVGTRLRLRRQVLKMSQERLGNKLGVTFQQIQKYERGSNRVGASRLWKISQVLNVDVGFFLMGSRKKAVSVSSLQMINYQSSMILLKVQTGLLWQRRFLKSITKLFAGRFWNSRVRFLKLL